MTDENQIERPDDERFDEWLRAALSDVNVPPSVPRDAMWAEIQARRAAAATPVVRPIAHAPSRRRWLWPAAVAAALLLGVALDRTLLTRDGGVDSASRVVVASDTAGRSAASEAGAPHVADVFTAEQPLGGARGGAVEQSRTVASGDGSGPRPKPLNPNGELAGTTAAASMRVAAGDGPRTTRPANPVGERAATDPSALYQLAAVQTLAQAEVLLTSWRSRDRESVDSASMHRLGTWARDVLGSTRLLLDSPAAEDPKLGRLLGDLELVLVQLVQLTGGALTDEDRLLIDRALGERDLLPRLRTAVPSGTRTIAS